MEELTPIRRKFLKGLALGTVGSATSGTVSGALSNQAAQTSSPPREASGPPTSETRKITVSQSSRSEWQSVEFSKSFDDPVVVMKPPSIGGDQPCHVRLRNVTGTGFEFQIEEWQYLDGRHRKETTSFVAIESGVHTTEGGTPIEVGKVPTNTDYRRVDFAQQFPSIPAVLTQSQTYNGNDPVVTRQQNVSRSGTEVRLQEEESRGRHKRETVGYIAAETGTTVIDGTEFEFGRTPNEVTDEWYKIAFQRNQVVPQIFADMQTENGGDTAELRYRNLRSGSVEIQVEEEQSQDDETNHASEVVGFAVADPIAPIGETGSVTTRQPDGDTWRTVSLEQSYEEPVVVMKPVSVDGDQPAHIRLRNVAGSSFEFQIEEWEYLDGAHRSETMDYFVAESGTYTSPTGTSVEVGTTSATTRFTNVDFTQRFTEPPVVLTQAQTYNGPEAIVTRQRNVTASGTELRTQEEEARGPHARETVGYIAVEPGAHNFNGVKLEAGRTANTVTQEWSTVTFDQSYDTPQFLTDMQSTEGRDPATLRYRNLSSDSVEIKVGEEQSQDEETNHKGESAGYIVLGEEGTL